MATTSSDYSREWMDRLPLTLGGENLPTYDDLAAQLTFYDDDLAAQEAPIPTYDEDLAAQEGPTPAYDDPTTQGGSNSRVAHNSRARRWSTWIEKRRAEELSTDTTPLPPLLPADAVLHPTHLKLRHFGSRFLPHSTAPIRCLVPLKAGLLLIGHDEGLSVLDMYPQDRNTVGGIDVKGPEDAVVHVIWKGESVFQMSSFKLHDGSGAVLMLIGPTPESSLVEAQRTIRMYRLTSLVSLAKWAVATKGAHPLNVGSSSAQQKQTMSETKNHSRMSSFGRGLKSFFAKSAEAQPEPIRPSFTPSPFIDSPALNSSATTPSPHLMDALPLRWARDFVPLAGAAGLRLLHTSVISFSLRTKSYKLGGYYCPIHLAVAIKSGVLLYESPVWDRPGAFRFIKEFRTPLQPKTVCFFWQHAAEVYSRFKIFVVFEEKKAGWIKEGRSSDPATKTELFEVALADTAASLADLNMVSSPQSPRRTQTSLQPWLPPVRCKPPVPGWQGVYVLTRGATSHLAPSPLPLLQFNSTSGTGAGKVIEHAKPLAVVSWRVAPTYVAPRVVLRAEKGVGVLQLTAFGNGGVEVVELPLSALGVTGEDVNMENGKGKARGEADVNLTASTMTSGLVRAEQGVGVETGFLCVGGDWDNPQATMMDSQRSSTDMSRSASWEDEEDAEWERWVDEGVYGWCRTGKADWRVFWIGGSFEEEDGEGRE
ncbi:hypothetical protein B0H19DRAFT_1376026 [Mycena capillaripes]|nr:hypothetical protein B0H19DRAFT_1376026 [Mycena capillaripes]